MMDVATELFEAVDATWPPARVSEQGPWTVRAGEGGGKRVSAATAKTDIETSDVAIAEAAMQEIGQRPLFMVRDGERMLDAVLERKGYEIVDPVVVLACPIRNLTNVPIPPVTTFEIWEPLAIMEEIWAKGGIGPERLAVMHRARLKTAIFARWNQKPAGTGFVAVDGSIAMVHAVEVLPEQRRQSVASWIMRHAAAWAQSQGASTMAVLCTRANTGALGLYSGLGFQPRAGYHYRQKAISGDQQYG